MTPKTFPVCVRGVVPDCGDSRKRCTDGHAHAAELFPHLDPIRLKQMENSIDMVVVDVANDDEI